MNTTEVKVTERETDYGYGNKYIALQRIMFEMIRNMKDRDCTPDAIALFQNDFLKMNDFKMPESFLCTETLFDAFWQDMTIESSESTVSAKTLYEEYLFYCMKSKCEPRKKGEFFTQLRIRNMLCSTGTVNGKTVKNVVKGIKIRDIFEQWE